MQKLVRRIVAGGAALVAIPVMALTAAGPSQAEVRGTNATVKHGAYKAVFHHAGREGETLEVFDNASDGYAAVAYVKFYWPTPEGRPPALVDTDRFVVKDGYESLNLREEDRGSYDVPEGHDLKIMICRGYKSNPGDNCSPWKWAVA